MSAFPRGNSVDFKTVKRGMESANTLKFEATIVAISRTAKKRVWLVTATTHLHELLHQRLEPENGKGRILRGLYDVYKRTGEFILMTPSEAKESRSSNAVLVMRTEFRVPDSELGISIDLLTGQ